jgi:hypothetical protein
VGGLILRRILPSGVVLALLVLVLLAFAGICNALVPPGPLEENARSPQDSALAALGENGRHLGRQLCVVVDGQQLRARFELEVRPDEELAAALWRSGGPGGTELVDTLLGEVDVASFTEWPKADPLS